MKVTLEQMIIFGIHLGHPTFHWNPKMSIYTYGIREGIHLIDLIKTRKQLTKAHDFVKRVRANGDRILFVGTKVQRAKSIQERAIESKSFYINKRWLGGTLTNWITIRQSLLQLHNLEQEKKKGKWDILPKKKVIILRKRLERLEKYLGGLKGIRTLPSAVVIVGQKEERTAILECIKLNIPVVRRLDTDCDPSNVKIAVPINDDSNLSIRLFLRVVVHGIKERQRLKNNTCCSIIFEYDTRRKWVKIVY